MPGKPAGLHDDPGLQPERTLLSWGRTLLLFCLVGAVFLRWLPHYGGWAALLTLTCTLIAGGIHLSQRSRYRRHARGVFIERVEPDLNGVAYTTAATVGIGLLGLSAVLLA